MPVSEKDRLAAEVERTWSDFQDGLFDKRRYPLQRFTAFWESAKRYAEVTRKDPLVHRSVVVAVNGLTEFLQHERKRIPESVLWDAQRLECLVFSGYDPHFEGDRNK